MKSQFSIAICPNDEVTAYVKEIKDLLKSQIGWYNSCNSGAHISVKEFNLTPAEIDLIEKHLDDFCVRQSSVEVVFNRFEFWNNGTICLTPDEISEKKLAPLMQSFVKILGTRRFRPHLTIARNLKDEVLKNIKPYWETKQVSVKMKIDNVTMRQLDHNAGQYEVYKRILFGA
jgi:2'-5' RNA ligase